MSSRASDAHGDRVRLDSWLWAARFFKTRRAAADAIDGGRVQVSGDRVKRAKLIAPGEELSIRIGPYLWRVAVLGLAQRRLSPAAARLLYAEHESSRIERERVAEQLKLGHALFRHESGERPTKRDRRQLDRLKRGGGAE